MRILFVSYGGGHIRLLLPIIKRLRENKHLDVKILALTTAPLLLEDEGIDYIGFKDLAYLFDEDTLKVGAALHGRLENGNLVSAAEASAYLGISYMDLCREFGEDKAQLLYESKGRQAFIPIASLARMLAHLKPDLLIATSSPRAEKAAFLAAKGQGIKSLCLTDVFDLYEINDRLALPGYGHKICVISDEVKRDLISKGRPGEEIEVTGNPAFDRLADKKFMAQGLEYREKMGWANKRVIMYIGGNWQEGFARTQDAIIERLKNYTKNRKDTIALIRPHVNQAMDNQSLSENCLVYRDLSVEAALWAVDCVVMIDSTVAYQAALLGKPVLQVPFDDQVYVAKRAEPYARMGVAYQTSDIADFEVQLDELYGSPPNPHLARQLFFGESTDRVINVISDLIKTPL